MNPPYTRRRNTHGQLIENQDIYSRLDKHTVEVHENICELVCSAIYNSDSSTHRKVSTGRPQMHRLSERAGWQADLSQVQVRTMTMVDGMRDSLRHHKSA